MIRMHQTANKEELDSLYECLRSTISATLASNKLLILGLPKLGHYCPSGIGKMNASGLRLLELSSEHELIICNTFLRKNLTTKIHGFTRGPSMIT